MYNVVEHEEKKSMMVQKERDILWENEYSLDRLYKESKNNTFYRYYLSWIMFITYLIYLNDIVNPNLSRCSLSVGV